MSDLAPRLLEAIQAEEKRATDCLTKGRRWWDWQQLRAKASWLPVADAVFIALHDPSSVLKRCEEDRKAVERFRYHQKRYESRRGTNITNRLCLSSSYFAAREMLEHVANRYGISVEEETTGE